MLLYSGLADVLIGDVVLATVQVHLEGDPEGEWGGSVRAVGGEAEPPEQLNAAEWVLGLDDGRVLTVSSAGHAMQTGEGYGIIAWNTGVDGIGPFPLG